MNSLTSGFAWWERRRYRQNSWTNLQKFCQTVALGKDTVGTSVSAFVLLLMILPMEGLTETSTALSMIPVSQRIGTSGSAGQLIPGVRARVIKQDGSLARIGEEGELFANSPSLALNYFNDPQACVILDAQLC
jgi:acyl-CoA synthetase (AMP-forming)/AMP-acid ligase II